MKTLLALPIKSYVSYSQYYPYAVYNASHVRQYLSIRVRQLNFCSPLHIAISNGNLPAVRALQPGPADILLTDKMGNTAAHYAVLHPSVDMVRYLAEAVTMKYDPYVLYQCGIIGDDMKSFDEHLLYSREPEKTLRNSDLTKDEIHTTSAKDYSCSSPLGKSCTVECIESPQSQPTLTPKDKSVKSPIRWSSKRDTPRHSAEFFGKSRTGSADDDENYEAQNDFQITVDEIIMEGWLMKRYPGQNWKQVWAILTPTHLHYFRSRTSKSARRSLALADYPVRRVKCEDPVFSLGCVSDLNATNDKRSPVRQFKTTSENELQKWMISILSASAAHDELLGVSCEQALYNYNYELRKSWLNVCNKAGETPLIMLARYRNKTSNGTPRVPVAKVLQLAVWLIQNGCDIDAKNNLGQTALHISVRYGNIELAQCLVAKGADITIRNNNGDTVMDLGTSEISKALSNTGTLAKNINMGSGIVSPYRRIHGFSYLRMHFQRHDDTALGQSNRIPFQEMQFPYLTVSLYNAHHDLIEAPQNTSLPILRRESYMWWACEWEMQTPLENLLPGSFVLIELRSAASISEMRCRIPSPLSQPHPGTVSRSKKSTFGSCFSSQSRTPSGSATDVVAWCTVPLESSTINSIIQKFEMNSASTLPTTEHDSRKLLLPIQSDGSFLEVEFLVSQEGGQIDLNEYRNQPLWIHHHDPIPMDPRNSDIVKVRNNVYTKVCHSMVNISKLMGLSYVSPTPELLTMEKINMMRISELKFNLDLFDVDYSLFVEKSEFRMALKKVVLMNTPNTQTTDVV